MAFATFPTLHNLCSPPSQLHIWFAFECELCQSPNWFSVCSRAIFGSSGLGRALL